MQYDEALNGRSLDNLCNKIEQLGLKKLTKENGLMMFKKLWDCEDVFIIKINFIV